MGKKTFIKGIVIGAVVGGLVTLYDRDVRSYVKTASCNCLERTKTIVKNPTQALECVQSGLESLEENMEKGLNKVEDTLEQLEDFTESFLNK